MFPTALSYLLYYAVPVAWALSLFFAAKFVLAWWRREPARAGALLSLAAIAAAAAAAAWALPARGGYENNHDFLRLGADLFSGRPLAYPQFKEYSPLFTDALSDLFSGRSLRAVLWKNRLLPAVSLVLFFAGLRRLGAGFFASAGAAALLFLNFLSLLHSSAFSTASSNMLIWLISLAALFDAHAAPRLGTPGLLWIAASSVLVAGARFEFLPANFLVFSAVLLAKPAAERRALLAPRNLLVLAGGAALLAGWLWRAAGANPAELAGNLFSPAKNLLYHLGEQNLGVLAAALSSAWGRAVPPAGAALLCALFLLACVGGSLAGVRGAAGEMKRNLAVLAVLLLWITYFSMIFTLTEAYPLHLMRHHLYFFLPFALLFAAGLNGLESAAERRPGAAKKTFLAGLAVFLAAYAALNVRAALGFNGELRTNDRELAFLAAAKRDWPPGCLAVYPGLNPAGSRAGLLSRYFPVLSRPGEAAGNCLLKYVSAEYSIFSGAAPRPIDQQPLRAGPGAWREASFAHAFYTVTAGSGFALGETTAPVPLTIGFYRLAEAGRDRAYLESAAGLRAFSAGALAKANRKFKKAVRADPSCLNCKYYLALSEAALGRGASAAGLLGQIDGLRPEALTRPQRELISGLAAGERQAAADRVAELEAENPDFFFRENPAAGIASVGGGAGPDAGENPGGARPRRAGEAASKEISDRAVGKIREGDLRSAKLLLAEAMDKDEDNFEARMSACYLAARLRDREFGEAGCGEAVDLAVSPPAHAVMPGGALEGAYLSRAHFYLAFGEKRAACADFRLSLGGGAPGGAQAGLAAACGK